MTPIEQFRQMIERGDTNSHGGFFVALEFAREFLAAYDARGREIYEHRWGGGEKSLSRQFDPQTQKAMDATDSAVARVEGER